MANVYIINKYEPNPYQYATEVDTTSKGSFKDLSPFHLGPINIVNGANHTYLCLILENLWQYSKVYQQHAVLKENGDPNNPFDYDPTPDWLSWRHIGFASMVANRYPMKKGAKPLYSFYCGHKMDYYNARENIYIPWYANLVIKTKSYALLHKWHVDEGRDLVLRDFDGYDHIKLGLTLNDVTKNLTRPMGHAFVLAAMLTGSGSGSGALRPIL